MNWDSVAWEQMGEGGQCAGKNMLEVCGVTTGLAVLKVSVSKNRGVLSLRGGSFRKACGCAPCGGAFSPEGIVEYAVQGVANGCGVWQPLVNFASAKVLSVS